MQNSKIAYLRTTLLPNHFSVAKLLPLNDPPGLPPTSIPTLNKFFLRIPLFAFAFPLSYPVSSRLMSTPVLVREREQEGEIAIGSGDVRRSPIYIRSNATYALVLLVLMEQR